MTVLEIQVFLSCVRGPYSTFRIVGCWGRSCFRKVSSFWQSNRTCWTVSYGWLQLRQSGGCSGLNLLRWLLSLQCPVLNWKIIHRSGRLSRLILSCGLGLFISEYITRPVDPVAHLLNQTSLKLFLRICFTVELLQGLLGWSFCVPSLANLSAYSLPGMSECPGIHCRVILVS